MDFMLLFVDRRAQPSEAPAGLPALKKLARELAREGKLRRAGLLAPETAGVRTRLEGGRLVVREGAMADNGEAVSGFWLLDVASRDEAIDIAQRAFEIGEPQSAARRGAIDVHVVQRRHSIADPKNGTAYLFGFRCDPFLDDSDLAKMGEMFEFAYALERAGKLLETAPLSREGPPARVTSRGGETLVVDGPFAECKEVIAGYSLLRAASRADAIDIASRYPQVKWGEVEAREILEPA